MSDKSTTTLGGLSKAKGFSGGGRTGWVPRVGRGERGDCRLSSGDGPFLRDFIAGGWGRGLRCPGYGKIPNVVP